ncbi:hypothetical protein OH76DRAFT_1490930 [Lentinus brumalis]|uniref:Uncharacterized protein n=1 Tax=Lentinus brumalis TaxID=2498619 RepID=A0A371CHA1_9APHY|nr:hypothetical protein OH76DRAFT_1490930 [Polyporus brumalis]
MFTVPYPGTSFLPDFLPELTPSIMEFLDGEDFSRLRQVSRLAETYVAATIHTRTRTLFADTPRNYDALIDTLHTARAVVGAAGAVYILFPMDIVPRYFHIYVPPNSWSELVRHLERRQGFTGKAITVNAAIGESFPEGVQSVTRFNKGSVAIDVLESTKRSPLYPIASQLHTGYFNYVSTQSFECAYPSLTRQYRALLNPQRLVRYLDIPQRYADECQSWRQDGWTIQVEWEVWAPGGQCAGTRSLGCASATRAFGDRWGFSGNYAAIADRTQRLRSVVDELTVVWWRGGRTCGPACHSGQIEISPGSRQCLRRIIR